MGAGWCRGFVDCHHRDGPFIIEFGNPGAGQDLYNLMPGYSI